MCVCKALEALRYLKRNVTGKSRGATRDVLDFVMRGEYGEANKRNQKAEKKTKEDWIGAQCEEINFPRNKNNSKRAYQLVKDLTPGKQGRYSTIKNRSGKCLTEEQETFS